jgi:hypothetical protein
MSADLTRLIDLTYKLGCGVSIADVEASRKFAAARAKYATHEDPITAAHIECLGDHLIASAGDCLLRDAKTYANRWQHYSAERQLISLRLLGRRMRADDWYAYRHRKREYHQPQTHYDVLPRKFGHWRTGPIRPSCLGMAAMLASFAVKAGAPHYMVMVLHTNLYTVYTLDAQFRTEIIQFLQQHIPVYAEQSSLLTMLRELEEVREARDEIAAFSFHPALILQLADGSWVLWDVYFETITILDHDAQIIDQAVNTLTNSDASAVVPVQSTVVSAPLEGWTSQWKALSSYVTRLLTRLHQQPFDSTTLTRAARSIRRAAQKGGTLEFLSIDVWKPPVVQLEERGLCSETSRRSAAQLRAEMDADPKRAEYVVGRFLHWLVADWYTQAVYGMDRLANTMPHAAFEVQPANVGIGINALNNMRCFYDAEEFLIGAELVCFSDGQSIWHDSRQCALREGTEVEHHQQRLRQREEALRTLPNILHPQVARLLGLAQSKGDLYA